MTPFFVGDIHFENISKPKHIDSDDCLTCTLSWCPRPSLLSPDPAPCTGSPQPRTSSSGHLSCCLQPWLTSVRGRMTEGWKARDVKRRGGEDFSLCPCCNALTPVQKPRCWADFGFGRTNINSYNIHEMKTTVIMLNILELGLCNHNVPRDCFWLVATVHTHTHRVIQTYK